jgi:hypothetical protein
MSNRSEVQNHFQAAGAVDRSSVVEVFLKDVLAGCGVVPVHDIEARARDAGLLGRHQSITDSKTFKAAKKILAIRSVRTGFSRRGWWGWALPSPETSVELAIEAPTSVVYGENHSRPEQCHHHTGAGANDHVGVEPDPVPSEWNKGIARLDHGHAPHGVPLHRWRQFVNDCHVFMTAPENWSIRARALGWDTVSLFGCCSTRPLDHLGRAGLLWNLAGGKLTQLHKDWAMISAPDGSQRTFHRRPFAANLTLPWRLR